MGYKTSKAGLDMIKRFEGLRLDAYLCPAGVPTIGYGTTEGVKLGMKITKAEADVRLAHALLTAEIALDRNVTVDLNQNQVDALVSFIFNVGVGAFAKSTMLKKINKGDFVGAQQEFARWNKGGGKVLPGLVTRRSVEAAMFAKGSFAVSNYVQADAPVVVPKLATIGTTIAAAGATASAAAAAIQPLVPMIPHLGVVFAGLSLVGIAAAAYANFRKNLEG